MSTTGSQSALDRHGTTAFASGGVILLGGGGSPVSYMAIAAEFADARAVNLMSKHACGLVCLCITAAHCDRLDLLPLARRGVRDDQPLFTESIEARVGVSTGISAFDRATTIRAAIDPAATPTELVSPGHVFPIVTRHGDGRGRSVAAEAAVTLAERAGLIPAGVICAILGEDGHVATEDEVRLLGERLGLPRIEMDDLLEDDH